MPNENKQCIRGCEDCRRPQEPCICPCHQPEAIYSKDNNKVIHFSTPDDTSTPSQEERVNYQEAQPEYLGYEDTKTGKFHSTPSQEEKMPSDAEFLNRKRGEIGLNLDAPVKKNGLVGTMASLTDEQDEAIEDEASALRRNPSRDSVYLYQLIHSLLATKIEIEEVVGMIENTKSGVFGNLSEEWRNGWKDGHKTAKNQIISSLKQKLLALTNKK